MSNTAAMNGQRILSRIVFSDNADLREGMASRFEPVASILAYCEAKTGKMMPAEPVHA